MNLQLQPIERVSASISAQEFRRKYFKTQTPVVIEKYAQQWPAYEKWNFEYIKQIAGDKTVPLYDNRPVSHKDGFNEAHAQMLLEDYIDLLEREPTKYRIFLWNILKEVPGLQKDFDFPDLGLRMMKALPMLFFGGADSYTFMHYDIDLANIFHFHFQGKKKCILFDQKQTPHLYKIPFSLITREDIDFMQPDLDRWPALSKAVGYEANLEHGDMLYMPEGYWHYMHYLTPGFSMSLRALARQPKNLAHALYNIFIMRHFDQLMRKLKGQQWIDWKNNQAQLQTA